MSTSFALSVYAYTLQVPVGKITTYKLLAQALGNENASRAVGKALSTNPYAPWVPCHRVISSDGKISGFFGSTSDESVKSKINLLDQEGVIMNDNGGLSKADLNTYLFSKFTSIKQVIDADYISRMIEDKKRLDMKLVITGPFRGMVSAFDSSMKCIYILDGRQVKGKIPYPHYKTLVVLNEMDIERLWTHWGVKTTLPIMEIPYNIALNERQTCAWCKGKSTNIALRHQIGLPDQIIDYPLCEDCIADYKGI